MVKTAKNVTFDSEIFESLKKDSEENGRDFSGEVNFACKNYLEKKHPILKKLDFELICKKLDYFDGRPQSESGFDPYKTEDQMVIILELQELILDDSEKTCTFGNQHPFGDRFLKCRACNKFHLNRNPSQAFTLMNGAAVMGWASTLQEAQKICKEKNWWLWDDKIGWSEKLKDVPTPTGQKFRQGQFVKVTGEMSEYGEYAQVEHTHAQMSFIDSDKAGAGIDSYALLFYNDSTWNSVAWTEEKDLELVTDESKIKELEHSLLKTMENKK